MITTVQMAVTPTHAAPSIATRRVDPGGSSLTAPSRSPPGISTPYKSRSAAFVSPTHPRPDLT